ncbi:MAG TPA: PhaM family polyhydroxyalkanoate granule multifunctional regulatory protein, partial [Ideonella sp.]|nr:PhaM family polyhydroxyalkanoate granule multifunctional regulatory protein [Ideonella sp.]
RIEELRTVQFWLEQNARMLGATIQALEVQRMTLSTLKTMNVQMGELRDSMKLHVPGQDEAAADDEDEDDEPEVHAPPPAASEKPAWAGARGKAAEPAAALPPGVVDPMQWWGALTKQFTELAASAVKDTAADAAKNLAGAMVKQGFDAAGETLKRAAAMPAAVAKKAAAAAGRGASPAAPAPAKRRAAKTTTRAARGKST